MAKVLLVEDQEDNRDMLLRRLEKRGYEVSIAVDGAEGVENVQTLSGHRCTGFGESYGVLINGGPLDRCLARAVFVIDGDGTIKHAEYVSEIADEPDYDAALAAAS